MTRPLGVKVPVPMVDLGAQQDEIADEVEAGLKDVFAQASFISGPAVDEFEQSYARFLGARNCVGVANGTDALELALRASGVTAGGEVIPTGWNRPRRSRPPPAQKFRCRIGRRRTSAADPSEA